MLILCVLQMPFLFVQGKDFPLEHKETIQTIRLYEFVREGNLIVILKGFVIIDNTLKNDLENGLKNAKMCSGKIQNEIIACIAKFV